MSRDRTGTFTRIPIVATATLIIFEAPVAAATGASSRALPELLPWLGGLVLATVVGGVILMRLRRGVRDGESGASGLGFTLHDLREMHARGELSDEEFQRARSAMVDRVRGRPEDDGTPDGSAAAEEAPHDTPGV